MTHSSRSAGFLAELRPTFFPSRLVVLESDRYLSVTVGDLAAWQREFSFFYGALQNVAYVKFRRQTEDAGGGFSCPEENAVKRGILFFVHFGFVWFRPFVLNRVKAFESFF